MVTRCNVFNVRLKTTLLPVWPRDATRLDTPGTRPASREDWKNLSSAGKDRKQNKNTFGAAGFKAFHCGLVEGALGPGTAMDAGQLGNPPETTEGYARAPST